MKKNFKFLSQTPTRHAHGFVLRHFRTPSVMQNLLKVIRYGLVLGMFMFLRLEYLYKFRRLRKVDMYRRRNKESRDPIFLLGTIIKQGRSSRDPEKTVEIVYMDKWFNRFSLGVRLTAQNFLGMGRWDIRSFFRPYRAYLGRKNAHHDLLEKSLKKRPARDRQ